MSHVDTRRAVRARHRSAGRCACGLTRAAGRVQCVACLARSRRANEKLRERHPEYRKKYMEAWNLKVKLRGAEG